VSRSAVYQGRVAHRRLGPVPRSFSYRVFMPLLDLDELPGLLDSIPAWSARRPAPARVRDGDYLPGGDGPLADRARELVRARLGRRSLGPVQLLANPRYLGIGFNPVSFLFVHSVSGELEAVIAEVTNTPWGERTAYVLDAGETDGRAPIEARFQKRMHVSPFQPMDQVYEISVTAPGERLTVVIRNLEGNREVLVASLALRRFELTRARMLGLLARYPPVTLATLTRIYVNALRLRLRGARVHPHPEVSPDEQAVRVPELSELRRGDQVARGTRLRDHYQATERGRNRRSRGAPDGRRGDHDRAGR
jgi:DUF1365 family protein